MVFDFFEYLVDQSPVQALQQAMIKASKRGATWRDLLGIALRGDTGMNLAQRREFASRRLNRSVRSAMSAFRNKQWKQALSGFLQVRKLAMYLKQSQLVERVEQAIVQSAFPLAEYELALQFEKRVLEQALRRKDKAAGARARNFLGVIYSRLRQYKNAVKQLNQSIEQMDSLELSEEAAQSLANLALAHDAAARYHLAIETSKKALQRFRSLSKHKQALRMMRNIGTAYLKRLNMTESARRWYEKALTLTTTIADQKRGVAVRLDLIRCDLAAGRFEDALELVKMVKKDNGNLLDSATKAQLALEKAKALWYLGEYQEALVAQDKALQYAQKADDVRLRIAAKSLGGLIALNLGDLDGAQTYLDDALSEAQEHDRQDEVAVQLNNLGIVAREKGDYESALARFEQARVIDFKLKSTLGMAYDLRNLGIVEHMLGRMTQAKKHLDEALSLSRSVDDKFNVVKTLIGLARIEMKQGLDKEAAKYAHQALALSTQIGLREVSWRALRTLGQICRQQKKLRRAKDYYKRAIQIVEQMRASLRVEQFRSGFLDNKYDLYEDMVHLLVDLGQVREAFSYTERSRARGFLDLLANRQLSVGSAGDKNLLDRLRENKRQLGNLAEQIRLKQGQAKQAAQQKLAVAQHRIRRASGRTQTKTTRTSRLCSG